MVYQYKYKEKNYVKCIVKSRSWTTLKEWLHSGLGLNAKMRVPKLKNESAEIRK